MPYRTTWEERGIVWTYHGDVTAREISRANEEFYNDERSDTAQYQIIDAERVASVEWSDRDIRETAAHDVGATHFVKDLKVAYVTRDPEIAAKMEKYIDLARSVETSWQFRGFEDMESARAWATA